jgi:hypothetical protein
VITTASPTPSIVTPHPTPAPCHTVTAKALHDVSQQAHWMLQVCQQMRLSVQHHTLLLCRLAEQGNPQQQLSWGFIM